MVAVVSSYHEIPCARLQTSSVVSALVNRLLVPLVELLGPRVSEV
jgi:hypothetical protein